MTKKSYSPNRQYRRIKRALLHARKHNQPTSKLASKLVQLRTLELIG